MSPLVTRRSLRAVLVGVFVGVVVIAASVGCSEVVRVRKVLVDVSPGSVAAGVERERVRGVVDRVLGDARGVSVDGEGPERALRVRIDDYVAGNPAPASRLPAGHPPVAAGGGGPSSVTLTVEVLEGGRVVLRGASTSTAGGVAQPDALVEVALREALEQIVQAQATDSLGSDELLAVLRSPDESDQRRRRAMATLGSRRDRRATPLVLPLLNDDDATVRQAALQALTLLADPDAVEAIIAAAERQPALVRRQCIDAVKSTDSPLAAAWLFVLSTGHPDAEVQAHARAALAALPTTSSPLTTTN